MRHAAKLKPQKSLRGCRASKRQCIFRAQTYAREHFHSIYYHYMRLPGIGVEKWYQICICLASRHTHTNRLVARQINWNRLTKPAWQCIWAKLPSFGCIKWHKKAKDILMASRLVDLPMASNKSQECQATWNNLSQANDQNKAKGSKKGAEGWWSPALRQWAWHWRLSPT